MAKSLDVWLHGIRAGVLEQDESGNLSFRYASDYLDGAGAVTLSQSLPLRPAPFAHRECRPFFAGLLPEEALRELIAKTLGISARNDFALLDGIGGECAGAVMLLPEGAASPELQNKVSYRHLSPEALARILDKLPDRPLMAGEAGLRLSLAGAQDKLPVFVADGEIVLPLDGTPSSHILKLPVRRFPDTVLNEGFCLALANAAGLYAVEAEIRGVDGREFLLVERYDRRREPGRAVVRLHQEDFCQALGVPPDRKYQAEGGPTLAQCFDLVRRTTARPARELSRLLEGVLFNALIGNNDAHAKNFSLRYGPLGPEFAPLYDLLSTAVYDGLSPRLAMSIDGQSDFDTIYPRHWQAFATEAGLGGAQMKRRLLDLAKALPEIARRQRDEFESRGFASIVIHRIVETIDARCRQTLERFGAMA